MSLIPNKCLISAKYVKSHFPLWDKYCIDPDTGDVSDNMLLNAIEMGHARFYSYVSSERTTMTEGLRADLLTIIKYIMFGYKHGDADFENKPQIVKDYDETIKRLAEYKSGDQKIEPSPVSTKPAARISSKKRLFGGEGGRYA